jgi:hypothetical protein
VRGVGTALLAAAAFLAACGDDGGGSAPDRLYLALLDSELTVQLVEEEPDPF